MTACYFNLCTTLGTSARSVVEVLMNSQRSLKLPSEITKENKTKKDVLFNDVIKFLQKKGLAWGSAEADVVGKKLVMLTVSGT